MYQSPVHFSKYIIYSRKEKLSLPKNLASLQQKIPFKEQHLLKNGTAIMPVSADSGQILSYCNVHCSSQAPAKEAGIHSAAAYRHQKSGKSCCVTALITVYNKSYSILEGKPSLCACKIINYFKEQNCATLPLKCDHEVRKQGTSYNSNIYTEHAKKDQTILADSL